MEHDIEATDLTAKHLGRLVTVDDGSAIITGPLDAYRHRLFKPAGKPTRIRTEVVVGGHHAELPVNAKVKVKGLS